MIRCECPHCGKRLKVDDRAAGRVVKCPRCFDEMTIAASAQQVVPRGDDGNAPTEPDVNIPGNPDLAFPRASKTPRRRWTARLIIFCTWSAFLCWIITALCCIWALGNMVFSRPMTMEGFFGLFAWFVTFAVLARSFEGMSKLFQGLIRHRTVK
jgi:hypothetical protein